MYWPKPGLKRHPMKRWNRPDRIFFGFGACHILAGVYLQNPPLPGFHAERICPAEGLPGTHIYVTDGQICFDFHEYSSRARLWAHYQAGWQARYPGWQAEIRPVTFDLLDTAALNAHKHLGPDQYPGDVVTRARMFLTLICHDRAADRARATLNSPAQQRRADS